MRTGVIILVLALVAGSSLAIKARKPSLASVKRFEELQKDGNSWTAIMMGLAQLQAMTNGPLDELVNAINNVIADLTLKMKNAESNFERRSNQHDEEVRRLNGEIDKAKSDIANTETFLNEVLIVQRANLEQDIVNLNTNIDNTRRYIEEITTQRANDHAAYEVKIQEHNDALAALDECLRLLSTLDSGEVSLAQVNKIKKSMNKVQSKLHKSAEAALLKALVTLATSEFANTDALKKVVQMMEEVKANLEKSLVDTHAQEEQDQANFNTEVKNKNDEINNYQLEIEGKQTELEHTVNQIAEAENFLAIRKNDLVNFEKDLESENASYEHATQVFNDLMTQFQAELDACHQASEVLNSAEFAGYISDRMSQDVVIDQPHGTGLTVN